VWAKNDDKNTYFAAKHLETSLSIQDQIKSFDVGYRELAMLLSGGKLNSKLGEWGKMEVNKGNLKRSELSYVMSLSLMKLSILAQSLDMNKISQCHLKESQVLMAMSKGKVGTPANCRQEAYGKMQVRAIAKSQGKLAEKIDGLTNKWATSVIMFSDYAAKLDNYGIQK
jgi:hypothetical protein